MERVEEKNICKKCGGKCCKKCGCDYFVDDFKSLKIDDLMSILERGNISIVSVLKFTYAKNGKMICIPFLYLRARNNNREIVDLLSMKTRCMNLTDEGCRLSLDDRPSGGAHLPVSRSKNCHYPDPNYLLNNIERWEPYQKTLERIVKRLTGMSVQEKLKKDVKALILRYLNEDFEGVLKPEQLEIQELVPLLAETFKDETDEAYREYKEGRRTLRYTLN